MKKSFFIVFVLGCLNNSYLMADAQPLHAFRDYGASSMQKMEVLGQVTSKSHMSSSRPRLLDYDTREMILSAKLYENKGIRIGDTIYIVQKDPDHRKYLNGLIVGKATIFSIFQTEFQGWMIKARGNLSMVQKGHFIARLDFGYERNLANEYLKKGDKFKILADYANAFFWYKKSLDIDDQRPETYLKLAELSFDQKLPDQALAYIKEAWKRGAKIEDPNDILLLPGIYLKVRLDNIKSITSKEKRFDELLVMLKEIRDYNEQMNWVSTYIQPNYKNMLDKAGIPDYNYQYGMGSLYQEIYSLMKTNSIKKVLQWVDKDSRDTLFKPLYLAYSEDPYEYPKKSWDSAYFEASIYHFKMANEIDELDTRAAYEIIMATYNRLIEHPSMKDADRFKMLIKHYGRSYLRVPDKSSKFLNVQNVLNNFDQF
jgi:tetratricopeptide (TPR) repeat protein